TVYRPAVIAGDSRTGYTNTYHGLMQHLRFMEVLFRSVEPGPDGLRHVPLRLPMTGDEKRNIVPVDWVSAVLCRLLQTPAAQGSTYHGAPREPMTPRMLIAAVESYYGVRGAEFRGPAPRRERTHLEQWTDESLVLYQDYETTDPTFDTTNTERWTGD